MENKLPKRKNLRLKNYDYSQPGYYFITICTHDKKNLFGKASDNIMAINDAGNMVGKWYEELPNKFKNIKLDVYIVMPNHFHCIIVIAGDDLGVVPNKAGVYADTPLPNILQWFKTMTTNEYIKGVKSGKYQPFHKQIWQRGYYEYVIRNEQELQEIREYIVNNPAKWMEDEYFI